MYSMRHPIVGCLVLALETAVSAGGEVGQAQRRDSEAVADVSMIQLIATPERFDRKQVRVIGFCWLEFEGNALYLHRDDYEQGIASNGVWLGVGWPVPSKYADRKGKYVIVEGTFSADRRGHFGMYSGSLNEIVRLDEWRKAKDVTPPPKPP